MSAPAPARTRPSTPVGARSAASHRPSLRLVASGPLSVGRMPFALLVGGILAIGLVTLLLLHTLAAQDAFRLQNLQAQQASLSDAEQELELVAQHQQAPHVLARHARQLGMVPTGSIAFVKTRAHGEVVGVVHAAPLPPEPQPAVTPSAKASERATATADAKPHDKPATRPADKPTTKPAAHRRAERHPHG